MIVANTVNATPMTRPLRGCPYRNPTQVNNNIVRMGRAFNRMNFIFGILLKFGLNVNSYFVRFCQESKYRTRFTGLKDVKNTCWHLEWFSYVVDMKCNCGSGLESTWKNDARGIPLARVCPQCRDEKLSKFRLDVLTDPEYDHDEPIDPEWNMNNFCGCDFAVREFREDKYGQCHRWHCKRCGRTSNWHTEPWKADIGFNQECSDKRMLRK